MFAVSALFLLAMYGMFEIRWAANDDVAVAMAAHGYGIAAVRTPNINLSNGLGEHFVRATPSTDGTLGSSSASLRILAISGTGVLLTVWRARSGRVTVAALFLLNHVQKSWRGMVYEPMSPRGIRVVAGEQQLTHLAVYCRERLLGELGKSLIRSYGAVHVSTRWCEGSS